MEDEYLIHYGVLGMKWGIRKKSKKSSSKLSPSTKKVKSKNSIKSKAKSLISKINKEKVKNVSKVALRIGGRVLAVSLLGYVGSVMYSEIERLNGSITKNYETISQQKDIIDAQDKSIERLFKGNVNKIIELEDAKQKNKEYLTTIVATETLLGHPEKAKYYNELLKELDL